MPIKIGITGGIGSGKSVVARLLEIMGIPVYLSDVEAKRIIHEDLWLRGELCALVGDDLFAGGALNRAMLSAYLFADAGHAEKVNRLVHPLVKTDFRRWVSAPRNKAMKMVAIESAILIEAGFRSEVDVLVAVCAPREVRLQRAMRRDGASKEAIERRIEAQLSDEERTGQADYVIENDGTLPLLPQVMNLIASVSEKYRYLCPPKP